MGNKNVKQTVPKNTKPLSTNNFYERDAKLQFSRMKFKGDNSTVPLTSVSVKAQIYDVCSEIAITHVYKNNRSEPLEAIFEFSLYSEESTVCGLSVQIGDQKIIGKVKERQKAFNTYDDAIASGHNAFLVESKGNGVYTLTVGSLAPKQEAQVTISVISELVSYDPSSLLFLLPNTMFPLHDYPLSIDVDIYLSRGVKGVKCNVDKAQISKNHVSVTSPQFNNFSLILQLENPFEPSSVVEIQDNSTAFMLNFFPTWENVNKDLVIPDSELIFVVDRSGSMAGSRINSAKSSLQLFLRSLPEGVIFNIVGIEISQKLSNIKGFGSSQEWLFKESSPYTESNLQQASQYVDSISANLGGTELLAPLQKIFSIPFNPEHPRQLFVITDGEVDNTSQVIDTARRESRSTRIFTLGIGEGASEDLVKGLAKCTKGAYEFIKTAESMESKVISQLERALEPCLKQVKVNWGVLPVKQGPVHIRPVFNGERLVVYGLLEDVVLKENVEIVLEGVGPEGTTLTYKLNVDVSNAIKGNTIHRLAAKQILRDLKDSKSYVNTTSEIDAETIRLGVKYQLATDKTSFVAVAEREEAVEGAMVSTTIPSAPTYQLHNHMAPSRGGGGIGGGGFGGRGRGLPTRGAHHPVYSSRRDSSQDLTNSLQKRSACIEESEDELDDDELNDELNEILNEELEGGLLTLDKDEDVLHIPKAVLPIMDQDFKQKSVNSISLPSNTSISQESTITRKKGPLNMHDVVKAQKANGSWELEDVEWLTKADAEKLKSGLTIKSENTNLLETCWATCIVMAILEKQYASSKNEWNLVKEKARKFVVRSLHGMNITEDLFGTANTFVKSKLLKVE